MNSTMAADASIIAADHERLAHLLEEAFRARRPIIIRFASGREVLVRPEPDDEPRQRRRRNATWAEIKARRADALDR